MTKDEALKMALEALENLFGIPDKWTGEGGGDVAVWRLGGSYRAQQAITSIKEALAQPEHEPVAWLNEEKKIIYWHNTHETDDYHGFKRTTPLYTTPPQRKPLTDEEIIECENLADIRHRKHMGSIRGQQLSPADEFLWHFARAIEAAHGIKGEA